jgi:hypothetical protein
MDQRTHIDAASHLRVVEEMRQRARRAMAVSPLAIAALGVLIAARGAAMELAPDLDIPAWAWLAVLVLVRPPVRHHLRRRAQRTGAAPRARSRVLRAVAALAAVAVALLVGANALIAAVGGATAVAIYFSGLPALAAATVVTALVAEAMLFDGAAAGIALLVFGAGLVAIALTMRAGERQTA